MKKIKSKYSVDKITRLYNDVVMALSEISDIKIPSPPRYKLDEPSIDLSQMIEQIPKTDDELVVDNYMKAVKKMAPGAYNILKYMEKSQNPEILPLALTAAHPMPKRLTQVEIIISRDDYKKLGSPSLDDVIEITLNVAGNKQNEET